MNIRSSHNNNMIETMNYYRAYQSAVSGLSNDAVVEYFWFTIKPSSPSGSWIEFQNTYPKLVASYHRLVCELTVGSQYKNKNKRHLKPFLCAAPDYEDSNNSSPKMKNTFNHVHGLICLQQDQVIKYKNSLLYDQNNYFHLHQLDDIRAIVLKEIKSSSNDLYYYINYMNKNTERRYMNINSNMTLPNDEAFTSYITKHRKPYKDGSRLNKEINYNG